MRLSTLLVLALVVAAVQARVALERSILRVPHGWTKGERVSRHQPITLQLFVKQQNIDALNTILLAVSDPSSPTYGKHLSLDRVNQLIAPTAQARSVVTKWLQSHGIGAHQITATDAFDIVMVNTEAQVVEAMLEAEYFHFHHKETGKCILRAMSYSVPAEVAEHLDFVGPSVRFPRLRKQRPPVLFPVDEYGLARPLDGDLTPDAIRTLYNVGDYRSTNANNSAASADFLSDYFDQTDLDQFFTIYAPNSTGQTPVIVGPNNASIPGYGAMLDIEYIMAIGAGVHAQFWYTGGSDPENPGGEPFLYFLQNVSSVAEAPLVFSINYREDEDTFDVDYANRINVEFQKAGVRGITLVSPSGDFGVGGTGGPTCQSFSPEFPASSPYVLAVGGTTETGPEVGAYFSGGGFSNYFARPTWQDSAIQQYFTVATDLPCTSLYSHTGTGYPDVSAQAISYEFVYQGLQFVSQGTECGCPAVAGMIALLNDIRLNLGKSPLGFVNPLFYQNPQAFNDITIGSNPGCDTQGFYAATGWDPVTGLGTFDFGALATIVKNLP